MARTTFDEILSAPAINPKWPAFRQAAWHYFNPNGAYAAKKEADKAITQAVEEGLLKAGCIIAYGSMNSYHADKLSALAMMRRCKHWDVQYHVRCLQEDTAKALSVVAEARKTKGE